MHAQGALDSSYRHVRIRHAVACAVLAILLMAVRPAGAPLDMRLHVDASLRTNAVYHLACLGGSISCSRDIFERFWKDRLHESVDDRERVAAAPRERSRARARNEALATSDQCGPDAPGPADAKSGDCRSHRNAAGCRPPAPCARVEPRRGKR